MTLEFWSSKSPGKGRGLGREGTGSGKALAWVSRPPERPLKIHNTCLQCLVERAYIAV